MLSFQLFAADDRLGALNLYASRPDAFGAAAQSVGELFAVHTDVVLAGAQGFERMGQALTTRDVIGQAKGILMASTSPRPATWMASPRLIPG